MESGIMGTTNTERRFSTGVPGLDERLGGGLIPGTLTVIVGASGIGKTQLGVQFAAAGKSQEGHRGIFFDLTSRGDSQNHAEYARRIAKWELDVVAPELHPDLRGFFEPKRQFGDYMNVFGGLGRRVTRKDLPFEEQHEWAAELARRLTASITFFHGNFTHGVRRCVLDGIEPVERTSESIQFELIEYIYHQILRKDSEWVARDLFREKFRSPSDPNDPTSRTNETLAQRYRYEPSQIGALLLQTSAETSLETLLDRPLGEGDLLSNANTVLYMGRIRDGMKFRRAIAIFKHRGSVCDDSILPYVIDENGLRLV